MRKNNILKEKSFSFALKVIKLYKILLNEKKEYVLSKQILRSGTSIGAMVRESQNAASTRDFLNKLTIALKEADETQYRLELLHHSEFIAIEEFTLLDNDCNELISILVASVKTIKLKLNSPF
ncbi:MAG: four helix bundle protein [Bacteroidota bacterium]|nr:four helix bundle protein [Bacteroidota bacterium]